MELEAGRKITASSPNHGALSGRLRLTTPPHPFFQPEREGEFGQLLIEGACPFNQKSKLRKWEIFKQHKWGEYIQH
ncbi:hypothetical protein SAMN04515695_5702 [Pseudovibrio sp. Tun.PSC04-5.I4]|nr:hypothetical protein SAMN04515695_5702 [Pseudovibrio sp. Tun.PSC04-5.I4]